MQAFNVKGPFDQEIKKTVKTMSILGVKKQGQRFWLSAFARFEIRVESTRGKTDILKGYHGRGFNVAGFFH